MTQSIYYDELIQHAKAQFSSERGFNKAIITIAEQINRTGFESFLHFKSHFDNYQPVHPLDMINGTAEPDQLATEAVLVNVLKHVTVMPKEPLIGTNQPLYRGCEVSPDKLIQEDGYTRNNGQRRLFKHQLSTQKSIFISASKQLQIACEFAMQGDGGRFVYRLNPLGAISCNDYFSPARAHGSEDEFVFVRRLPAGLITGVAWAHDVDTLATDFYPLNAYRSLYQVLYANGYIA
ncbi:hypothetical protein [Alteromonas macleodii]|uniref:Uncharacterized protein n=1 Tax=Alteromonas macleodii TaxID=28108 RepID=A0AB36FP52_ALTMA|nr:hypothetical protein [Alteromonas macleodii]OES24181.1 hypothetical protein BFV93_4781 [Alteromonas macleodii]OES24815.1 hypothetical protein BFV95_4574 [Alteromonas macleodii]OES25093.1 hypothetical protein BFV94_4564 [Alteromonas macleodii]OES39136.1 hypothetical protein BFV96_4284 [Alteromonas macleodii]